MSRARLDELLGWYGGLAPENLARLHEFYAPDCRFSDPIHDFHGAERLERLYRRMFEALESPAFVLGARAQDGEYALVNWRFSARWRGRPVAFEGVSRLRFGADGRVSEHVDYWDAAAALYERLPLLGILLRALRRRLAAY